MPRMKTRRARPPIRVRRIGRGMAGIVALVTVVVLRGCASSPPVGDTTHAVKRATKQIAALPDVRTAAVTIETTTDGTTKRHAVAVDIGAPELGSSRARVADLIGRVLPVAWSVDGTRPDGGVVLRLHTSPQLPIGPIAEQAGWEDVGYPSDPALLQKVGFQATFAAEKLDEQLGRWPLHGFPTSPARG